MDWLTTTWSDAFRITLSTIGVYVAVIAVIRLNGLRSLSKMSSFDFVMSVAVGSIVASVLLSASVSVADGAIGLAMIFLCQRVIAWARKHVGASTLVDNTPIVLMVGERMLDDVLDRTRITRDDVHGKLREANVLALSEVHLVVLEATGDISVLHGESGQLPDARLLEGVSGSDEAIRELAARASTSSGTSAGPT